MRETIKDDTINYKAKEMIEDTIHNVITRCPTLKDAEEVENKTFNILKELYPFIGENWKKEIKNILNYLLS